MPGKRRRKVQILQRWMDDHTQFGRKRMHEYVCKFVEASVRKTLTTIFAARIVYFQKTFARATMECRKLAQLVSWTVLRGASRATPDGQSTMPGPNVHVRVCISVRTIRGPDE